MTRTVVAGLKEVLARSKGRRNVFAKIGDSLTISNHFLKCFAGKDFDLGTHTDLEPTRSFFNQLVLDAARRDERNSSFDHASVATRVGWTAKDGHFPQPSPIEKELRLVRPAFAFIMFGTNGTYLSTVSSFARDLLIDVDHVLSMNVIPLMSTIPPKLDNAEAAAVIPEMNTVIRAIAQARQVPLMDYYSTVLSLPDFGLMDDGVHPAMYVRGSQGRGCHLTETGLRFAMNQRNLVALTSLDRAKRFILDNAPPEADPPHLQGLGTPSSPRLVDAIPFADDVDTTGRSSLVDQHACSAREARGPEVVYELRLDKPTKLRVRVLGASDTEAHLVWLGSPGTGVPCASGDAELEVDAGAGQHRIVVETNSKRSGHGGGWYMLTIVEVTPQVAVPSSKTLKKNRPK